MTIDLAVNTTAAVKATVKEYDLGQTDYPC